MRLRQTAVESNTRRSLGGWVRVVVLLGAGAALAVSPTRGQSSSGASHDDLGRKCGAARSPTQGGAVPGVSPHGCGRPRALRMGPGRGARAYRLVGRWTGTVSWAVRTREHTVTARNATTWTPERVTLEVPLPLGNHSWRLMAVFGPNDFRSMGD